MLSKNCGKKFRFINTLRSSQSTLLYTESPHLDKTKKQDRVINQNQANSTLNISVDFALLPMTWASCK